MDNTKKDESYNEYSENFLEKRKELTLTKNELLHLSDSVTLLISTDTTTQTSAKKLIASAYVSVPLELIKTIGLGFLGLSDKENEDSTTKLNVTIFELYLLRECCQTSVKRNDENVGYNLLKKIYELMHEDELKERTLIDNITSDLDLDLDITQNTPNIVDELIEKLSDKENGKQEEQL